MKLYGKTLVKQIYNSKYRNVNAQKKTTYMQKWKITVQNNTCDQRYCGEWSYKSIL